VVSSRNPEAAADGDGNVIAVWVGWDNTSHRARSSRYVPGTGWSAPESIGPSTIEGVDDLHVVVHPQGAALALWRQWIAGVARMMANRYVPGAGWGSPELIESIGGNAFAILQLAMDGAGGAIAVWKQHDGTTSRIWSNRFDTDSGWGSPEAINDPGGAIEYPSVACDASGNAMAVWRQYNGAAQTLRARRYTPGSGWGTIDVISDPSAGTPLQNVVVSDPSGNVLVAWKLSVGTNPRVLANRFTPGGGWGTQQFIETLSGAVFDFSLNLAGDASGNAIAVWRYYDGTTSNVRAARYAAGSGWGAPQDIENLTTPTGLELGLGMGTGGEAVAFWCGPGTTLEDLRLNRYVPGTGWDSDTTLVQGGVLAGAMKAVCVDSQGNATVLWVQHGDTFNEIWFCRFQ